MTMTQGALVTEIRDMLDETTGGKWTDIQLRKWINEGLRDISRANEVLFTSGTISVTSAGDEYALPTGLIRLRRVEYYESATSTIYQLDIVDINAMNNYGWSARTQTSGMPVVCTTTGYPPNAKLILFPKPDTNATVRIYYYKLATELATDGTADASVLDVPEGWFDVAKLYAVYNALQRDRDQRWREFKDLYDEKMAEMKATTRQLHDQAGFIQSRSGSHVPRFLWDYDFDGGW